MPTAQSFASPDAYAATLAHELVHWTGHKSRCDRQFGKRFGDDAYAFEELVAEIGSAFVCAQMGIPLENLQHSSYIASWLKVLKADKRAIFTASSQAKRSSEFLITNEPVIEEIAA
jgi:antirestriction protein ArdC